jgi:glyoxylase-like metal-dependent hydrolase (beta-lactamase superfamily II)
MISERDPHPDNAPGDWYVDTSCIDCGASCNVAPGLIVRSGGQSVFGRQPLNDSEDEAAWRASVVCPTASVRTRSSRKPPQDVYPHEIGPGVFRCGYNSRKSFGAHSYFVVRNGAGFLVDSPRYMRRLVEFYERNGGITDILLTHRDDVADADRYAERFASRVWIHEHDAGAAPFAKCLIRGSEPIELRSGMTAIPTPGHTRGSVCYLLDSKYLFTGDTLAWSFDKNKLHAFRKYCWYSWSEQKRSLAGLAAFDFEWVLAGHGGSQRLEPAIIKAQLEAIAR